jgi:hypothetical protein
MLGDSQGDDGLIYWSLREKPAIWAGFSRSPSGRASPEDIGGRISSTPPMVTRMP